MKKDYLYIFSHIPKTAGYTFRYHIKKNFNKSKRLIVSYDSIGLDSSNPPSDSRAYRDAVDKYIKSLSVERRNEIKIIYGHQVHYGIHHHFNKPARYFAFFRDPINRTPSIYKHLIKSFNYEANGNINNEFYRATLLINGIIPKYSKWLKNKYNSKKARILLTMHGFLVLHGFYDGKKVDRLSVRNALEKFYFVGITKNYLSDAYYLYYLLGIKRYFIDQNISTRVKRTEVLPVNASKIISLNIEDVLIYKMALSINNKFKHEVDDYYSSVNKIRLKRSLLLLFTQIIYAPRQTLLRIKCLLTSGGPLFKRK